MSTITVLKDFYDLVERVDRHAGETFDADDERAAYIDEALPGYVEVKKKAARARKAATKE